jgi:hypothetical protein
MEQLPPVNGTRFITFYSYRQQPICYIVHSIARLYQGHIYSQGPRASFPAIRETILSLSSQRATRRLMSSACADALPSEFCGIRPVKTRACTLGTYRILKVLSVTCSLRCRHCMRRTDRCRRLALDWRAAWATSPWETWSSDPQFPSAHVLAKGTHPPWNHPESMLEAFKY